MLMCLLAALFSTPGLALVQDKPPEKVLTVPCERDPMAAGTARILYTSDGKVLACSSKEGLLLWEMPEGKRRGVIPLPEGPFGVAFSQDGKMVAISKLGANTELQIWDAENCKEIQIAPVRLGSFGPACLAFCGDGSRIAALTVEGVTTFATSNLQRLDVFKLGPQGLLAQPGFKPMELYAHPDGKSLIVTSSDPTSERAIYVDFKTGKARRAPVQGAGLVDSLALSRDGTVLATVSSSGAYPKVKWVLKLWDSRKQSELWSMTREDFTNSGFGFVQLTPDARIVGCVCNDASQPGQANPWYLHLWSVKDHSLLWPDVTKEIRPNSFTFSPDGKSIAVVHDDTVTVWKLP